MPDVGEVPEPVREGRDLLDYFYGFSRDDDPDRYLQQDEFRQDVYRLIVIQLHLAIEEMVRSFVFERLTTSPDPETFTHVQNVEFTDSLNSKQLLELAARLHVLSKRGYDELVKLNAIRNKCSHRWILHSFSTAEKIKALAEPGNDVDPRINFNGKNLLTPEVIKDEFMPLYGNIYLELWCVYNGVDHEHLYTDEALETVSEL